MSTRTTSSLIAFCEQARELIAGAQRILLCSHVFPEADSVGSQSALARHLLHQGRQVVVCNPTPVSDIYRFLIDLSGVDPRLWTDGDDQVPVHDLIIILDVNDWDYMGLLGKALAASPAPKLLFDHHQHSRCIADAALIDSEASATGEVLYRYFLATGAQIDRRMAAALYASILFDTGGFRFRNTRDDTLLIAAELIRRGASHTETAARLFENESFARVELLTSALSRVMSDPDGRIAWTYITTEMFRITSTSAVDADGIVDQLMTIRGVELGILFRELHPRRIKVTFRSKGDPNVSEYAERLGGGGRRTAAGVTLASNLKEAMTRVLALVHGAGTD